MFPGPSGPCLMNLGDFGTLERAILALWFWRSDLVPANLVGIFLYDWPLMNTVTVRQGNNICAIFYVIHLFGNGRPCQSLYGALITQ